MAKKQTRRSISVSGDTYNGVRDYCDEHGLSASGLVTDLLNKYLEDHGEGPEQPEEEKEAEAAEKTAEAVDEEAASQRTRAPARLSPPQAAGDVNYPDRRGPGFTPLPEGTAISEWQVTARLEISRKRRIDAQTSVETLLHNLIHRRMVNNAQVVTVELLEDD